jgi:WS/DGAT/MGAT family acyltransferase
VRHLAEAAPGALSLGTYRARGARAKITGVERVSPTAAALLRLESGSGRMHVGWLARLDGGDGRLDVASLLERVARRVQRTPRLRQSPAATGHPLDGLMWREPADFDVARHVVAMPESDPLSEEALRTVVDDFLAAPLAHGCPLWQLLVVPRTRAGGAVIAGKLHRALVDGDSGLPLHDVVFDPTANAQAAADALALDEMRALRQMEALAPTRGGATPRIGATLRRAALGRTVGPLMPAPPSFLAGQADRRTTLVTARVERGRIARIASRAGVTDHDVVLTVLAGTLRRLALAGGVEPADVRALVPVAPDEGALLADAPCVVLDLPVAERHPASRLAAVHGAMAAALRPRGAEPRHGPTVLAGPPEELPSRLALGARVCNLTIPSAHGPAQPLHVGGVRVRALFPITAAPDEHGLAVSTLRYDRHVHLGVAADVAAVRGVRRLPVMLADAVEELGVSTGARPGGLTPAA